MSDNLLRAPDRCSDRDLLFRALDLSETEFAAERSAIELDPQGWLKRRVLILGLADPTVGE